MSASRPLPPSSSASVVCPPDDGPWPSAHRLRGAARACVWAAAAAGLLSTLDVLMQMDFGDGDTLRVIPVPGAPESVDLSAALAEAAEVLLISKPPSDEANGLLALVLRAICLLGAGSVLKAVSDPLAFTTRVLIPVLLTRHGA